MEETAFVASLAEIEIVAIREERKRNDGLWRGSDDLGVTAGRNVAEPEAVETIIAHGDEQEFSVGEMAVRSALPEVVAGVMEYWAKGRGALGERKARRTKPAGTSRPSMTTAASNAVFRKLRFAGIAGGGMAALCCVVWAADPPEEDCGCGAESTEPVAMLLRPEPVSRLRRFRSARMSEACW